MAEIVEDTPEMGDTLLRYGRTMVCAAGDTIFREGDPAREMFVVLAGVVEISSRGRTIETIERGDALGIVSLIDGLTRTANAEALTDCELALLDVEGFRAAVSEVPAFMWFVLESMAQRLRATNAAL